MQKNNKTVDMTEGPFFKKMLVFAIPIILTGLLQCLYNAADLVVVGQFRGDLAVAAVGSTGSLTNLIIGLFLGLSVGSGVCVAHHIGAKEPDEVKKVVHTSVVMALLSGVVIAIVGFFLSESLLKLMDTPPSVLPLATLYMKIFFLGAPAGMLYNYLAAIMRSAGDSKHPLIFLAISGIVNVFLNVYLILVFHMGVDGVAIATIASQYLSAIMATVFLARKEGVLHLSFKDLRIHGEKVKKILHIGIPSGIQSSLFSISNVLIQSSINSFGDAVVAGSAAAASIEGFLYIAMNSIYHVALTFIGQSVGARKYKNIKPLSICSSIIVTAIGVIGGALILLFHGPLVSLYVTSEASTAAAMQRLWIIASTYWTCGLMDVFCAALRALDRSVTAMIISLCGACGFRILWIGTVFKLFPSPEIIYVSYPISWIITFAFHLIFTIVVSKKMIRQYSDPQVQET